MTNLDKLLSILHVMENEHVNLYHDISKPEVLRHIDSIKNINKLNAVEFDYEMLKFFALFKEAHTNYTVQKDTKFDFNLHYINNKIYVELDDFYEVKSIQHILSQQLLYKFSPLIACETQEWKNYRINNTILKNPYYFEMLGLLRNNQIFVEYIKDGKVCSTKLTAIQNEEILPQKKLYKKTKLSPHYTFQKMQDDVLYIKLKKCKNDKNYPFNNFLIDTKNLLEQDDLKYYIIDVRNNTGGMSQFDLPMVKLFQKKKLKGVVLMNNGTISSGRFVVAHCKKDLNSILVGESTGGAIKSYGNRKDITVNDVTFSVSTRYFDFSDTFDYEGAIQPDIFVPTTIEDMKKNKDNQLEQALTKIEEMKSCK